jgi:hypothetical protein
MKEGRKKKGRKEGRERGRMERRKVWRVEPLQVWKGSRVAGVQSV